jgi:tripartite-type tricarboxylate transporter receptor subunit TctC
MTCIDRRTLLCGLGAGVATLAAGPAHAQEFPSQPVKLIVPYPPGGGVDTMARPLAEKLAAAWGKPVIVENKPGASTIIGTEQVVNAAPDGHTLLFTTDSSITSNPHLFKKLPFDPITQLAPVTQLVDLIQLVLVHRSITAKDGRELIALARKDPKALNYGSYGTGSQPHLFFEALKSETGIGIEHVPFKGLAPAMQAVVSGETQMTLAGPGIAAGHIKSGAIRALAICYPRRIASLPDVPTIAESGFPDVDPRSWFGLLAPAKTLPPVIARIARDVTSVLGEAEFRQRVVEGRGFGHVESSPDAFARFIAADLAYKARLIKAAGIKPE